MPLVVALFERITPTQKKNIVEEINSEFVFNFRKLINCFQSHGKDNDGYCDEKCHCICGVEIHLVHIVTNFETNEEHIIGSDCINNWGEFTEKKVNKCNKIIRSIRKKEEKPIFCFFCYRQNCTKLNCSNCKEQISIKTVFDSWKTYTNKQSDKYYDLLKTKIYFGKYKGKLMASLCKDFNYANYMISTIDNCKTPSMFEALKDIYKVLHNFRYKKLIK